MLKLDSNQWNLVYNVFSFGLVSMLACTIYTLVSQQRVLAKYRNALVMSSMVHSLLATTTCVFSTHSMNHLQT